MNLHQHRSDRLLHLDLQTDRRQVAAAVSCGRLTSTFLGAGRLLTWLAAQLSDLDLSG